MIKKLNTLDKIVIEIDLEKFKEGKRRLGEVAERLSGYEKNQYDTKKYREQLRNIMLNKYSKVKYNIKL